MAMSVGRSSVVLLALVLLVSVLPVQGAGQMGDAQPETDDTVTRIRVQADGDAKWTVRIRTRLRTEAQVSTFETFRTRFRANRSRYLDPFRTSITRVVAAATNATGRPMRARNFSATATVQAVPRRWGVVTYRFEWTNFAAGRDDRLAMGDAFQSGFFLAENDSLVVRAPPGYRVAAVNPDPEASDDRTVRWAGRTDFPTDAPSVTFAPVPETTPPTNTNTTTNTTRTGPPGEADSFAPVWASLAGALLLGLGGAVYLHRRRSGGADDPTSEAGASKHDPPRTDGDRVVALVEANGGQMRQAAVVDELDWSKSKVSRVLSDLHEEGRVEKVKLGRENLVRLPEAEP